MTYWQKLRREWIESAAFGGIVAWLCCMYIVFGNRDSGLIEYAVSFMFVWPVIFIVDFIVASFFWMIKK